MDLKKDFPIFSEYPGLAYLDSAATTQKPSSVIDAVSDHYRKNNANVHRGMYALAISATETHDNVREQVSRFIGADSAQSIIFVRNATEGINLVANTWGRTHLKRGDEVLVTLMEHHANIVPWHMLAKEQGIKVVFAGVDADGFIDERDLKGKVSSRTKLAAFAHASNVLGTINPVKALTSFFHKRHIPVLIDGAQAVPHIAVNVRDIGCDFYVFSAHKMLGPSGIGVLYMKGGIAEGLPPYQGGGDMIVAVSQKDATYQPPPLRFEAGTPAMEAASGLGAAIDYLDEVGMKNIRTHEIRLTSYALAELRKIAGITVFGPRNAKDRTGVIAFDVAGIHPHDIASLLDAEGIAVRAGNHCAMPLHTDVLKVPATTRMSFYMYNDIGDIVRVVRALRNITAALK